MVKRALLTFFLLVLLYSGTLYAINSVDFGGMDNGAGFTEDQVDIVENLIINDLVESSFFSLKSVNLDDEVEESDLILKGSIGYVNDEQISIKLWLIDSTSNQIILARELPTTEDDFFVQLDQFSTEFISIVYEFLYGATEENIITLVQMNQYEHANKLLNYYREKVNDPYALSGLEKDIFNGYASKLKADILSKIKQNQPVETDEEIVQYILYSSDEDLEFLDVVNEYQRAYLENLFQSLSKEIKRHLRHNNPELALYIYQNFTSQNGSDVYTIELSEMKSQIDEQLKIKGLVDAERNNRRKNFVESKYLIEESINNVNDPSDLDISDALVIWENNKESRELIELTEDESDNQWTAGFRRRHDINASMDTLILWDKNRETLINGFFVYPEISYMYQKPLLPPFYHLYLLSLEYIPGSSLYSTNDQTITTDFHWFNLLPGMGVMASFQKVDVGAILNAQVGFLYRSIDYTETIGSVIEKGYLTLGFEISLWGKYYFTDFLSMKVGIEYKSNHIFSVGWANGVGTNLSISMSFK